MKNYIFAIVAKDNIIKETDKSVYDYSTVLIIVASVILAIVIASIVIYYFIKKRKKL